MIPDGIEFVMPYELDNSLIVKGDEDGIDDLKALISKLDIAPKQIMVKMEFVEIDTNEAKDLGINWSLSRLNTTFATEFVTPGTITVGYANGNVIANLKAELSNNKAKLVNAPICSTMNNVPAQIQIQSDVPYFDTQVIYNSQGNPSTITIPQFLTVTTELDILPRVNNADNSITLYMMPQIMDIVGQVESPNGTLPITSTQAITANRRVANGETIVIGGMIRKNDSTTVSKIPLLADLPIIGPLFRTNGKTVADKETLIFVTPEIIAEKPIAGSGVGVTP